jgi:23S rRNA (adenine2503-C2)-methyltransferase
MSNIAKSSYAVLNEHYYFNCLECIKQETDEKQETIKFLFKLPDDQCIETVLMKFDYGYSVCISSQVGCNMGCKFCASGLLKKKRNLTPDEFVLQLLEAQKYLWQKHHASVTNIVIMGIGEPFDNYDNLKQVLNIFNNHYGIAIGSRHITVSTCGLINHILQFAQDFPQVNLAISLHAPTDELRDKLMPINKTYNLKKLITTIKQYINLTNRRISFEYILLKNINDSDLQAEQLGQLLEGLLCYVNIIVYNQVHEKRLKPSDRYLPFMKILRKFGITVTKRLERGIKINAACGQLRAQEIK